LGGTKSPHTSFESPNRRWGIEVHDRRHCASATPKGMRDVIIQREEYLAQSRRGRPVLPTKYGAFLTSPQARGFSGGHRPIPGPCGPHSLCTPTRRSRSLPERKMLLIGNQLRT